MSVPCRVTGPCLFRLRPPQAHHLPQLLTAALRDKPLGEEQPASIFPFTGSDHQRHHGILRSTVRPGSVKTVVIDLEFPPLAWKESSDST